MGCLTGTASSPDGQRAKTNSGFDQMPFLFAGLAVGRPFAVIGFFGYAMGLGHSRITPVGNRRILLAVSGDQISPRLEHNMVSGRWFEGKTSPKRQRR
jgi:hypothetical protein